MGYELCDIGNLEDVDNLPDYVLVAKIKDKEQKKKSKAVKRRKLA